MTNEVLQKTGSDSINFGDSGTFNPADDGTNFTDDTGIDFALTLSGLADGAGRQSAKADLGAARARLYAVFAAFDFTGRTPTALGTIDLYWAPSTSGTAANGNVAGNSGADAAAPGGVVPSGLTMDEFVAQCQYIGTFTCSDDATVQGGFIGTFEPPTRHGQLIIHSNAGDQMAASNVECHVAFWQIIDEIQDAA